MNIEKIHYIKSCIRQYQTNKINKRIHVNMDVISTDTKRHPFTWKLTCEKRELWRGLENTHDREYPHYITALDEWERLRRLHGHNIRLWIGKLHKRGRYIKGQINSVERISSAVSLLYQFKKGEDTKLHQKFWFDDLHIEEKFDRVEVEDYDQAWHWYNPESQIIKQSKVTDYEF